MYEQSRADFGFVTVIWWVCGKEAWVPQFSHIHIFCFSVYSLSPTSFHFFSPHMKVLLLFIHQMFFSQIYHVAHTHLLPTAPPHHLAYSPNYPGHAPSGKSSLSSELSAVSSVLFSSLSLFPTRTTVYGSQRGSPCTLLFRFIVASHLSAVAL